MIRLGLIGTQFIGNLYCHSLRQVSGMEVTAVASPNSAAHFAERWGIGTHSNKQGGAIMPEMLRWLWRDYARPADDPKDATNRGFLTPKEAKAG